jgi:hypothetical protein
MNSDRYVHPEFGFFSPTPRLRRELRTAFLSVLFGIGIGAATMIALNGNNDSPVPRGVNSGAVGASAIMDEGLQAGRVEDEFNRGHTSKSDGSSADDNSKNPKTGPTRTCEDNKAPPCLNIPAAKPRGMRVPSANDALAVARVPLGRSDASAWTTPPSVSSERAPERSPAGPPQQRNAQDAPVDRPDFKRLSHQKPHKAVRSQNRPRQEAPNHREERAAYWNGRGYDRPVGDPGRAYAHDRSFGQKGFWAWSD